MLFLLVLCCLMALVAWDLLVGRGRSSSRHISGINGFEITNYVNYPNYSCCQTNRDFDELLPMRRMASTICIWCLFFSVGQLVPTGNNSAHKSFFVLCQSGNFIEAISTPLFYFYFFISVLIRIKKELRGLLPKHVIWV